jgi:hypothetical protein
MREPDVWKERWETLKRKSSPTPHKSFPKDVWKLSGWETRAALYIFLCLTVGLSYLFYINKEDTRAKTFFKGR